MEADRTIGILASNDMRAGSSTLGEIQMIQDKGLYKDMAYGK
jgi:hypothetical protein